MHIYKNYIFNHSNVLGVIYNTLFLSEPLIIKINTMDDLLKNIKEKKYEIPIFGYNHRVVIGDGDTIKINFNVCFNEEIGIWQLCESDYVFKDSDGRNNSNITSLHLQKYRSKRRSMSVKYKSKRRTIRKSKRRSRSVKYKSKRRTRK